MVVFFKPPPLTRVKTFKGPLLCITPHPHKYLWVLLWTVPNVVLYVIFLQECQFYSQKSLFRIKAPIIEKFARFIIYSVYSPPGFIIVIQLEAKFRKLRMQRFYLKFCDILHVIHLHYPFLYWWAFRINQRLKIISPYWKLTFILCIPEF